MFANLVLAASLIAAPVPKDTKPSGPAPRILDLVPNADGKVVVQVIRTEQKKVQVTKAEVNANGQQELKVVEQSVPMTQMLRVELSEVKDLTVFTADGKEANKATALKALAEGGVAIVSTDGNKVDPKYLKLFRDDVFVLVSPELKPMAPQSAPTMPAIAGDVNVQVQIQGLPLLINPIDLFKPVQVEAAPIIVPGLPKANPAPALPPALPDTAKKEPIKEDKKKD